MSKCLLGLLYFPRLPRPTEEKRKVLRDWVHTSVGRSNLEDCSEPRRNFYTVLCRKICGFFALRLSLSKSYKRISLPVMSDYWFVKSVNLIRQTMWLVTLKAVIHQFSANAHHISAKNVIRSAQVFYRVQKHCRSNECKYFGQLPVEIPAFSFS